MRGWLVLWGLVVASVGIACAPVSPDTEDGGGAGDACASLRVIVDSPGADEVLGTWKAEVAGRVEGAGEIRHLFYEVDGRGVSLPAHTGPFSFTVDSERRREVRFAVRAQTLDGCTAAAERVVLFDTTRWVDLSQDDVAEVFVAAPGEEVVVHWKPKVEKREAIVPSGSERTTRRAVWSDSRGPEGSIRLTVQNTDMEVWDFDLGVEPRMKPLVITVGTSLQMVPAHATLGVGESQWITIPNALDAEWTVEPAAVLRTEPYSRTIRAGMRFEAAQPGTYTVRAESADGKRVGEATIEVKDVEQPSTTVRELPPFPEGFSTNAVVALPDGSLVAGGRVEYVPALLRLPRGGDAWATYADLSAERHAVTHLVAGEDGETFALSGSVLRISPDGTIERILEEGRFPAPTASIWSAAGTLYAEVGSSKTYAFDAVAGDWVDTGGAGGCYSSDAVFAVEERGLWHSCLGWDWLVGPEFHGVSLAPLWDLMMDEEGGLLAATSRGVHRLSGGDGAWEQFAGGGPSDPGTVFLRSGRRLLAGSESGLWTLARADQTWVRVPVTPPRWPFFVALPDGAIVAGSKWSGGGGVVEIAVGE